MALHMQTPAAPAACVSTAILAPSTELTHDVLNAWAASALTGLARFRSQLIDKPFGIGQPVWADVVDFDAAAQIGQATVPAPGGDEEFGVLVEKLTAADPSDRLLWQAWTVDGLAGGRWALVVKMSPVLADGGPGVVAMWDHLLSSRKDSLRALPSEAGMGPAPSMRELVTDTLLELVENQFIGAHIVTQLATDAFLSVCRTVQGAAPEDVKLSTTAMNARLTKRRSVATTSVAAADVSAISDAFGGNTANVILAACALSLRGWLHRHSAVPVEPLVLAVPLALPAGDPARGATSRAVGRVHVPVQLSDPVEVLTYLHTATERLNIANREEHGWGWRSERIAEAVALVPPPVARLAAQVSAGLGSSWWSAPRCHASVSFVRGPAGPVYCAGVEVVGMHTADPLAEGCGLGIVVTSHDDVMDICLTACPDNVGNTAVVATGIRDAVAALLEAAHSSPRGEGQSVVSEMTSHNSRR